MDEVTWKRPSSFKPLKRVENPTAPRPEGASSIYLEDEDGKGTYLTHVVTDANDGITDEDFDFPPPSDDEDDEEGDVVYYEPPRSG